MIETIQPPTDNLYKFLAIGLLAFVLVAVVFLFKEQARQRERYLDAHVELLAGGYVEGSGVPSSPELRRAYFQAEAAKSEASGLHRLVNGTAGRIGGFCVLGSIFAFTAWFWRVQRYDDAILRLTMQKLELEARATDAQPK